MNAAGLCCPQCQSEKLEEACLSQKGSALPIMFGATPFKKKELLAFACTACGHVFLRLGRPGRR